METPALEKSFAVSADTSAAMPVMAKSPDKPLTNIVSMCSKCTRKLGAEGKALRKQVKNALRDKYGEAVELEKVDCYSLCPKGGQVVSATAKNQPRRLVILEPASDVADALTYLLK